MKGECTFKISRNVAAPANLTGVSTMPMLEAIHSQATAHNTLTVYRRTGWNIDVPSYFCEVTDTDTCKLLESHRLNGATWADDVALLTGITVTPR